MSMSLTSPAFDDGARIPDRYTCEGENLSPPLSWTGVPETAKSLVILCDDPDAPKGTWHHWALYNLPSDVGILPADFASTPFPGRAQQAINDFKNVGYGGPAPPPGHGTHHYHFRLLALDTEDLGLGATATCVDVEAAAVQHAVAQAELIGTFSR